MTNPSASTSASGISSNRSPKREPHHMKMTRNLKTESPGHRFCGRQSLRPRAATGRHRLHLAANPLPVWDRFPTPYPRFHGLAFRRMNTATFQVVSPHPPEVNFGQITIGPAGERLSRSSPAHPPRSRRFSPGDERLSPDDERLSSRDESLSPDDEGLSSRDESLSPIDERLSSCDESLSPADERLSSAANLPVQTLTERITHE